VNEYQKFEPTRGSFSPDAKGFAQLAAAALRKDDTVSSIAISFAIQGDLNKAFEYLERGYSNREDDLVIYIRYPGLDPIRKDPRYGDLMKRMGLPQ